jgi:hypothetical protein
MKYRTLLLGSAAAFAMVGGAQASDLTAEPVEYVRICDAAGVGYWYSPGTEVCIKIDGYVQFQVDIGTDLVGKWTDEGEDYFGHYFTTEAQISVHAAQITDYGWLRGHVIILGKSGDQTGGDDLFNPADGSSPAYGSDRTMYLDEATIEWGMFLLGMTASTFDPKGGYTYTGGYRSDEGQTDQIRLSIPLAGWTLMIAAEDYGDRLTDWVDPHGIPDLVAAISGSMGALYAKVAFGYAFTEEDENTWGVAGSLEWTGGMTKLLVTASLSANGGDWVSYYPLTDPFGDYFNLLASVKQGLGSMFYVAATASGVWGEFESAFKLSAQVAATPTANSEIGAEVTFAGVNVDGCCDPDSTTSAIIRAKYWWPN